MSQSPHIQLLGTNKTWSSREPSWVHKIRTTWLPICFLFYTSALWKFFNLYIVTSDRSAVFSREQTIFLWWFRVATWFSLVDTVKFVLYLFLHKPPHPWNTDKEKVKNEIVQVKALIIRIVTKGLFRNVIQDSVTYHRTMVQEYLQCDHFSIHVLTEQALNLDEHPQVREIVVPKHFKARSGAIGKARNLVYWCESNEIGDLPESETWIIDIDEDVNLTNSFMLYICKSLLNSNGPKVAFPEALFGFDKNTDMINKFSMCDRFTIHLIKNWFNTKLLGKAPSCAHGGCTVARADYNVAKEVDCGQYNALNEDKWYQMSMELKGVKMDFIDGWSYEDAPPSVLATTGQRSRWLRGNIYQVFCTPVPWSMTLGLLSKCILSILFPVLVLPTVPFLLGPFAGVWSASFKFYPAGLALPFSLDIVSVLVVAAMIFMKIYACWFLFPWKEALFYSIFACSGIPSIIMSIVDLMVPVVAAVQVSKDLVLRMVLWKVTKKQRT